MKEVLVIGKTGQLSKALAALKESSNWTFIGREALDLSELETIAPVLNGYAFNILINAAAYTSVDLAEDESDLANRINHLAVSEIAKVCKSKEAVLVHISTDYVFNTLNFCPLKEVDTTNPQSVYGLSKLKGEQAIVAAGIDHLIVRTSWLYGETGKNFMKTMLSLGKSRKELSVVIDQLGSPTFVSHLARTILSIISQSKVSLREASGIYHYSNEGVGSWYDFAHAIFDISKMDVKLHPVDTSAFPTKAKRPPYSVLDKAKIKDTFGIEIHHWRDALRECMNNMNSYNE